MPQSDFTMRPFSAGTIVGLRAFDVDSLGRLRSPTREGIFRPGENIATCPYGCGKSVRVAALDCSCGFYAFTNGTNDYYNEYNGTVQAIVEGYGICTVGSLGFRAEKICVVAIVDPRPRMSRWRRPGLVLAVAVLAAALFLSISVSPYFFVLFPFAIFVGAFSLEDLTGLKKKQLISRFDLTRELYPETKIYRSLRSALKAHPLSAVPPASPSTTDDFWTNEGIAE